MASNNEKDPAESVSWASMTSALKKTTLESSDDDKSVDDAAGNKANSDVVIAAESTTVFIRAGAPELWEAIPQKSFVSLLDLKNKVVEALQPKSVNTLTSENIIVLKEGSGEVVGEDANLAAGKSYVAMEFADVVPEDLVRFARHTQIGKGVPTHPDAGSRDFAKLSPVHCAALSGNEEKYPPYEIAFRDDGIPDVKVHGGSMRAKNNHPLRKPEDVPEPGVGSMPNPFRAIGNEKPNFTSWTPQQFKDLCEDTASPSDWPVSRDDDLWGWGCLRTSITHVSEFHRLQAKPTAISETAKRHFFLQFVLKKGTDLGPHKMCLVRDQDDHWTLIFTQPPNADNSEFWGDCRGVLLPAESFQVYRTSGQEERDDLLRNNILPPSNKDPSEEPVVVLGVVIPDNKTGELRPHMVSPKVASLFEFDGVTLKLRAKAEPVPLKGSDDDETLQRALQEVMPHFERLDYGFDLMVAMDEATDAKYAVDRISSRTLDCLQESVEDFLKVLDRREDYGEEPLDAADAEARMKLEPCLQLLHARIERYFTKTPTTLVPKTP
ncbi:MAG: hypothetical protein SGILL_009225 [Bacillariaceae sp.]